MKLKMAVIFGGQSGEHEVSLVSGRSVMTALNPKKYAVTPVKISKTGRWEPPSALADIFRKKFSVVFPVLHGPLGEDGTIQGLLEMAGVAYVGCGVFASAAAMDKLMAKTIFRAHGLPQVRFLAVARDEVRKNFPKIHAGVLKELGFPCFVKPASLGSSVGISKVKTASQLKPAISQAAAYDRSILIEEGIDAREIECAVLGNDRPVASVAGEIVPSREFYDYFAKYVDNASQLFIPAKIPGKKMEEVQRLALAAYRALGCSGMGRVDFLMDRKTGKLYVNEINTIPGFTSISMYPKLWGASGIPYPRLLDRLIELSLERFREKQKNASSFSSGTPWYKKR